MEYLYASLEFCEDFWLLLKNKKIYPCFEDNFIKEFSKDKPYSHFLFTVGNLNFYKLRLQSCTGGKSYGFRIGVIEDQLTKIKYFVAAYPKYGKLSGRNLDTTEFGNLLEQLKIQKDASEVMKLIFKNKKIEFIEVRDNVLQQDEEE